MLVPMVDFAQLWRMLAKIFLDTGVKYSLDHVERAMFLEGLLDAKDVFQPSVKRKEYGF